MKEIRWNEKAREFVRSLDVETKREIGSLLMMLQNEMTLGMPQSRAMGSIHKNAYELRIKDSKGSYRVIYVLALRDMIFIPHAFTKKSEQTPKHDIDLSIRRLKEMLDENK